MTAVYTVLIGVMLNLLFLLRKFMQFITHVAIPFTGTGGVTQPTIYTIPTLPTLPTEEVCFLRHDAGSCQGNEVRYYYNYFYGRCTGFFYTGCAGNANNFRSEAECLTVCGHLTSKSGLISV